MFSNIHLCYLISDLIDAIDIMKFRYTLGAKAHRIKMTPQTPFQLQDYLVTPLEHSVSYRNEESKALQPKFIEVLAFLAHKYPQLVTREELIEEIWNGNQFVGEKALTNAVWNLRKALSNDDVPIIETIRKTGYRLLVEPQFIEAKPTITQALNEELTAKKSLTLYSVITIATLSIIGVLLFLFYPKDIAREATRLDSLTSAPGRELFPDISHDQKYLLYSWRKINHPADLFVKDLTQPDLPPKQLTFSPESEASPVWGRDNLTVYFYRKAWSQSDCKIIKMVVATSQETEIASCPATSNIYLDISPDFKTLAFTGNSNEEGTGIYFQDLTDLAKPPRRFSCIDSCDYTDRSISFSPDGQYAAVTRRAESLIEDVHLVNLSDNSAKQLTFGEGDIKGLTWSSDSKRVVYAVKSSMSRYGRVVDIVSGEIKPLNIDGFSFPRSVPNSDDIVFHQWRVPAFVAYMPLDSDIAATPFPMIQSSFSHTSAQYSAINDQIAYISNESGYNEIWLAKPDGTARKRLTKLKNNLIAPRWSHDGEHIAFLATLTDRESSKIYILNVNNLSVRELHTPFDNIYRPSWSLDGKSIIAAGTIAKDSKLYRIPVDGSEPEVIADTVARFAIETSDNKIWYVKNSRRGLWMIDLAKNNKPVQVIARKQFKALYNWTVGNNGIYFQTDRENHHRIDFYSFDDHSIKPIVKLPKRTLNRFGSMSYIESEKKLIFTQYQFPQVDIKRLTHPLLRAN